MARPIQAALSSAAAFAIGALPPLLIVLFVPVARVSMAVTSVTIVILAGLGVLAAWMGGAPMLRGAIRVTFWGGVAMGVTALVGRLFGTTVG